MVHSPLHFQKSLLKIPMLTRKKRRSGHSLFSSSSSAAISEPTAALSISSMGSVEEPIPAISNSAGIGTHDGEPGMGKDVAAEPLLEDLHQVHHGDQDAMVQESSTLPPGKAPIHQPLDSHPVQLNSAGDDESAPPPPDFTRRGIHIPTRTRYVMTVHGCGNSPLMSHKAVVPPSRRVAYIVHQVHPQSQCRQPMTLPAPIMRGAFGALPTP